ncbi:hypothetical protein CMV_021020 [Castanea mollissima]|uniref:Uncharacterized protein n=1 Tax=Castanea mollissima TaxID=60419 RepID=A0A8J4V9N5_9ROSI|nr:hypothetical protein CMV_021020 [Castanea mollissima]
MENDHGVRREGGFIRRINTLKRVVFAANFRQSYVAEAYQGRGERLRNEHHRSMARLLHEIIEGDYRCREALYDPRRHLESVGNRHIRRRNKQRRRRAQRRWIQAKGHLESCTMKHGCGVWAAAPASDAAGRGDAQATPLPARPCRVRQ